LKDLKKRLQETVAYLRERLPLESIEVGIILGTGLGGVADAIEKAARIPYEEIPHFPVSTVKGHEGALIVGTLSGKRVMAQKGRFHYYEGYPMLLVVFPVRVMRALGAGTLIVTNAAGGLNPEFHAGDVMLITDHINLIGMGGLNPLRGPNFDDFGPRFPDMSEPYDVQLQALARRVAIKASVPLQEGVYVCLAGPSFETPAELRFLRLIGADAVGMSTVPEVIIARHGGTRVLGLSGISNVPPVEGMPPAKTTHEEVLEAGRMLVPRLEAIIRGVLRAL